MGLTLALGLSLGLVACGEQSTGSGTGGGNGGQNQGEDKVEATSLTLSESELLLEIGDEETLTATVAPANATDKSVTWSSSAPAVATVDSGRVKALTAGTAVITAKTSNNKEASCSVTVVAPATGKMSAEDWQATLEAFVSGANYTLTRTDTTDEHALCGAMRIDGDVYYEILENDYTEEPDVFEEHVFVPQKDGTYFEYYKENSEKDPWALRECTKEHYEYRAEEQATLLVQYASTLFGESYEDFTFENGSYTNPLIEKYGYTIKNAKVDFKGDTLVRVECLLIDGVDGDQDEIITIENIGSTTIDIPDVSVVHVTGLTLNETETTTYPENYIREPIVDIQPENATYRIVHWTTDNPKVVIIDENGGFQAVGEGVAHLVGTVDGKSVTYTVNVVAREGSMSYDEWEAIFAPLAGELEEDWPNNFTLSSTGAVESEEMVTPTAISMNGAFGGGAPVATIYSEENGTVYQYFQVEETWYKRALTNEDDLATYRNLRFGMRSQMRSILIEILKSYSSFQYGGDNGWGAGELVLDIGVEHSVLQNVVVTIEDKKLVKIEYTNVFGENGEYTAYGNISGFGTTEIMLPDAELVESQDQPDADGVAALLSELPTDSYTLTMAMEGVDTRHVLANNGEALALWGETSEQDGKLDLTYATHEGEHYYSYFFRDEKWYKEVQEDSDFTASIFSLMQSYWASVANALAEYPDLVEEEGAWLAESLQVDTSFFRGLLGFGEDLSVSARICLEGNEIVGVELQLRGSMQGHSGVVEATATFSDFGTTEFDVPTDAEIVSPSALPASNKEQL